MEPRLAVVSSALALISDPFALVGSAFALVGHSISLVSVTVSPIKLPAPLLQPGGLRTGALSRLASPLGNSTLLSGLTGSSELHAPSSVHLGQIGCPLEHLGRQREDREQALRIDR